MKTRLEDATAPADIEARSFAIIDAEVPEPRPFAGRAWQLVRRLIHTSADFDMLELFAMSPDALDGGTAALAAGATVVTDTMMALSGIPVRRTGPLGISVQCLIADPEAVDRARATGTTRARAAMEVAMRRHPGAVFAIGNAPTALLRLLELVDAGETPPALVVGMPVGFVNADHSKALLEARKDFPWMTVTGRKGGSPLAAAAVNALLEMVLAEKGQQ